MTNIRSKEFGSLFLSCLHFHLLHLNSVSFAAPHIHVMIAHTQCQDGLVHPHMGGNEDKVRRFLICGLDDEVLVVESDVADLRPRKANLGS